MATKRSKKITLTLTPRDLETIQMVLGDHVEDLEDLRPEEFDADGWKETQQELRDSRAALEAVYPRSKK